MRSDFVQTSINLPRDLHKRLDELATRLGCSARQLILQSIEDTVAAAGQQRAKKRLNLDTRKAPLTGKPITLTDNQIYAGIEFP